MAERPQRVPLAKLVVSPCRRLPLIPCCPPRPRSRLDVPGSIRFPCVFLPVLRPGKGCRGMWPNPGMAGSPGNSQSTLFPGGPGAVFRHLGRAPGCEGLGVLEIQDCSVSDRAGAPLVRHGFGMACRKCSLPERHGACYSPQVFGIVVNVRLRAFPNSRPSSNLLSASGFEPAQIGVRLQNGCQHQASCRPTFSSLFDIVVNIRARALPNSPSSSKWVSTSGPVPSRILVPL